MELGPAAGPIRRCRAAAARIETQMGAAFGGHKLSRSSAHRRSRQLRHRISEHASRALTVLRKQHRGRCTTGLYVFEGGGERTDKLAPPSEAHEHPPGRSECVLTSASVD